VSDEAAERQWVLAAQAGSAEAFALLVRAHQQALRSFLRRLCGNWAEADDLAQEAFIRAFELIGRFDSSRPFRPWLFGIAFRRYREHKRSWARLIQRESRYAAERETVLQSDPGLGLDLTAALAGLPAEQRAALLLCLGQDFTHQEAAQALELPLGTVKSHVARGREKLVAKLDTDHG